MKYTQTELGRVFILKFDDGDIVLDKISEFAGKEKIKAASFIFIGALREGKIVTGPKKPVIPPDPNWKVFKDGWEVLGIGTVFADKKGPQIHIHTSMGKKAAALTGCVRKDTKVFLVLEVILFELKNAKASKDLDPATGLNLLKITG